jgi:hypothetical protein
MNSEADGSENPRPRTVRIVASTSRSNSRSPLFQQKYLDPVGVGKASLFRLVSQILLRICPTR